MQREAQLFTYCSQAVLSRAGNFHAEKFHAALNNVLAQHEIFQTDFVKSPQINFPLQVLQAGRVGLDYSSVVVGDSFVQDDYVQNWFATLRERPFSSHAPS